MGPASARTVMGCQTGGLPWNACQPLLPKEHLFLTMGGLLRAPGKHCNRSTLRERGSAHRAAVAGSQR